MTYSPAFQQVIALVLKHEGGFQNVPSDRGNWTTGVVGQGELRGTNFGISAMAYPSLDIRSLTREQAVAIYHRDYWQLVRGDELPFALACVTMDAAVNSGPRRAIEWLQRALGVTADGVLGPVTLATARGLTDPVVVATRAARHRLLFCAGLDGFATWGSGWVQRTLEMVVLGARGSSPAPFPHSP